MKPSRCGLIASCDVFDISSGYRFSVRIQDWASPSTAELLDILCTLKYIVRKRLNRLTDSRSVIMALANRMSCPMLSPLVHTIVHQIALTVSLDLVISVARVPAHSGIPGLDSRAVTLLGWLSSSQRLLRLFYSCCVCTRDHFARLSWDLDLACGYGAVLKDLNHIFDECPLLPQARPSLYTLSSLLFYVLWTQTRTNLKSIKFANFLSITCPLWFWLLNIPDSQTCSSKIE